MTLFMHHTQGGVHRAFKTWDKNTDEHIAKTKHTVDKFAVQQAAALQHKVQELQSSLDEARQLLADSGDVQEEFEGRIKSLEGDLSAEKEQIVEIKAVLGVFFTGYRDQYHLVTVHDTTKVRLTWAWIRNQTFRSAFRLHCS